MTISEACDLIVAMTAELVEARRDRDSYRLLAQQVLHALAALQQRFDQQQERYHALLEENRERRHWSQRVA